MQVPPESLVKTQELVDSNRGQQEGNCKARGVDRQQKNAARNRLRVRSQHQDGRKNRADARCPAEGKCKAKKKTAGDAGKRAPGLGFFRGLTTEIVEAHVAVEPARQRWSNQKNKRDRKQLH